MQRAAAWVLFAALLAGCSSSRQQGSGEKDGGGPTVLRTYEEQFTPSEEDPDTLLASGNGSSPLVSLPPGEDSAAAPVPTELVSGFRVQLIATTSIDEANALKGQAQDAFPGEWFYLEFDPPAYKLRAGNFRTRFEADRFARTLAARGFADAWTVPQRVLKSPPPVPPHSSPAPAAADSTLPPR